MEQTPYDRLGGEAVLRQLVSRFYELMDTLPEGHAARVLHPESLEGSAQKTFEFLSGWLGGPDLFIEKYGHPRLRARHLPYAIGRAERHAWMACMRQALEETVADEAFRTRLIASFEATADHMMNRA